MITTIKCTRVCTIHNIGKYKIKEPTFISVRLVRAPEERKERQAEKQNLEGAKHPLGVHG